MALAYAFYLSFIDMGESVSGWITAPIASSLNITLYDYDNVKTLIWISSSSSVASLGMAPLLTFAARP